MKKECFFRKGKGCSVLVKGDCALCRFCKTEEQVQLSRNKTVKRLRSLPDWQQRHIADTYYCGQAVWADG